MIQTEPNLIPRHQEIIKLVSENGFASIEQLSGAFQVTPQTIRRDINKLADLGILKRYHGGAGIESSSRNISYNARKTLYLEEKTKIAALAASHIPDHSSLFVNIGTTTEQFANELSNRARGLKVITNNLNVAAIMAANQDFEIIIAGGVVRSRDLGITGEATVDFIKQFKVDYGIIGVSGIDPDGALLDFDYHEVRVSKAIIENSRQTFLVTDSSKFGRNAMVRLGHISQISAIFTDQAPSGDYMKAITESGVDLFISNNSDK